MNSKYDLDMIREALQTDGIDPVWDKFLPWCPWVPKFGGKFNCSSLRLGPDGEPTICAKMDKAPCEFCEPSIFYVVCVLSSLQTDWYSAEKCILCGQKKP